MQVIHIEVKISYGVKLAYPACEVGKAFSRLTGKKTFNHSDLKEIETLGFKIEVKKPTLEDIK